MVILACPSRWTGRLTILPRRRERHISMIRIILFLQIIQIQLVKLTNRRSKEVKLYWDNKLERTQMVISVLIFVWMANHLVLLKKNKTIKRRTKIQELPISVWIFVWMENLWVLLKKSKTIRRRTKIQELLILVLIFVWMANHWALLRSKESLILMIITLLVSPIIQIPLVSLTKKKSGEVKPFWDNRLKMTQMVILVLISIWEVSLSVLLRREEL